MYKLKRLIALPAAERNALVEAALLLALVRLGLRLKGFRYTRARVERHLRRAPAASVPREPAPQARRLAQLVETAARHHAFVPTCLERSLALWALLARRGIAGQLRIGARRDEGTLAAHAWVEYRGEVLNDRRDVAEQYPALGDIEPALMERSL